MPGNKRRGQGYKRINMIKRKIRKSDEKSDLLKKNIKSNKETQEMRKKLIDNLDDQKDLNEFRQKGLRTILS